MNLLRLPTKVAQILTPHFEPDIQSLENSIEQIAANGCKIVPPKAQTSGPTSLAAGAIKISSDPPPKAHILSFVSLHSWLCFGGEVRRGQFRVKKNERTRKEGDRK